jgi:hypothetical protein
MIITGEQTISSPVNRRLKGYTRGSDGFYRLLQHFGTRARIIVRDSRGDLVREERISSKGVREINYR